MATSKDMRKTSRNFQNFLKERDLQTIYRRFISLKGKRKKELLINVGGENRPAIAFRTKNRILFRDPKSLALLSSTTKVRKLNDVPQIFKIREFNRRKFLDIKIKNGINGVFLPQFRRTDVKREIFKNTIHFETVRPLQGKVGKIFLSITFFKVNSTGRKVESITLEGGSRQNRLLTDRLERQKSFNEAFKGALSQLNFSYDGFTVNTIRFFYKQPKEEQRLVFA